MIVFQCQYAADRFVGGNHLIKIGKGAIVPLGCEEFEKAGLAGKVWQYFTVVPDFKSTGIKDGKRAFEWLCIVRAINTTDVVKCTVEPISYELMCKITERITHEVPGINRVLYDYTPKPTATVEYE